jgi:ribosomal protein S18 acetylase RimI-like enzyme
LPTLQTACLSFLSFILFVTLCQEEGLQLLALGVLVLERRRGIGTALLCLFLEQDSPAHVPRFLHVQPDNTVARDFYARAGFVAGLRLPGYYRGLKDSDALRMVKSCESS